MGAAGESDFERARAVLDMMGKNITHCGAVGTGQAVKICNNMLLAVSMIGVSETMNLGIKYETFISLIKTSVFNLNFPPVSVWTRSFWLRFSVRQQADAGQSTPTTRYPVSWKTCPPPMTTRWVGL